MKIFLKKIPNLIVPSQAHPGEDAAYDVVAATEPNIVGESFERPLDGLKVWSRINYIEYGTNLFFCPEADSYTLPTGDIKDGSRDIEFKTFVTNYHLQLFPRSSLSAKSLALANSVATIDSGYRGEIKIRFKYVIQPEDLIVIPIDGQLKVYANVNQERIYHLGDKIVQAQVVPNRSIEFEVVDKLPDSSRKENGFGSSGK